MIDPRLSLVVRPVGTFDGWAFAGVQDRATALAYLARGCPVIRAHRVAKRYVRAEVSSNIKKRGKGERQNSKNDAQAEIGGPDLAFERVWHANRSPSGKDRSPH